MNLPEIRSLMQEQLSVKYCGISVLCYETVIHQLIYLGLMVPSIVNGSKST